MLGASILKLGLSELHASINNRNNLIQHTGFVK